MVRSDEQLQESNRFISVLIKSFLDVFIYLFIYMLGSPLVKDDGFPVVVVAAVTGGIVFLLLTAIFAGVSVAFYNKLQTE